MKVYWRFFVFLTMALRVLPVCAMDQSGELSSPRACGVVNPPAVKAKKTLSRVAPGMTGTNLLPLFDDCCSASPMSIIYRCMDLESDQVRLNNSIDRQEKDQEIARCIDFIESFRPFEPDAIAQALKEQEYDPVGLMAHVFYEKKELVQHDKKIAAADIIRHLLALEAEITKIPDYHSIGRKGDFYPLGYNGLPATIPSLPSDIDLTTILPKNFIEFHMPASNTSQQCRCDSITDSSVVLPSCVWHIEEIVDNIASQCCPSSFAALLCVNKKIRAILLRQILFQKIPAQCIPRKILDSLPCDLIIAENMDADQLLRSLDEGFSKKWPNSGIAINFYGFKDPISDDLMVALAKYPIISLYFEDSVFSDELASLSKLTQLRELWIRNCTMPTLPKEICLLRELVALNIEHCSLKEVPKEISLLKRLKFLDLRNNLLDRLPEEIGDLGRLRGLILSGNRIHNLPESIGKLTQLRNLIIDSSFGAAGSLKELPSDLTKLKYVECIYAIKQGLTSVPLEFCLLANIQDLRLSQNNLHALPKNLFSELKNLRRLDLSRNRLTEFPRELARCKNLNYLDLSFNKIKYVPNIFKESALTCFLVARNLPSTSFSRGLLLNLAEKKELTGCFLADEYRNDVLFLQRFKSLYPIFREKLREYRNVMGQKDFCHPKGEMSKNEYDALQVMRLFCCRKIMASSIDQLVFIFKKRADRALLKNIARLLE